MNEKEIFDRMIKVIEPHIKNAEVFQGATYKTNIIDDLRVNSARLVDIIISLEDEFDIEIDDESADNMQTLGDAVSILMEKFK
jgi:acyl carrier protein